jgi:hypothetical protein
MRRVIFENYKPKKIIEAIEKLGADENDSISFNRLQMYIKKVLRGQHLQENKFRKIFLGIEEIKEYLKDPNDIETFYKNLIEILKANYLTNKDRWIFAIRHALFSTYKDKSKHKMLKEIFSEKLSNNLEFSSLANKYIYKYLKSDEEMEFFYMERIYEIFFKSFQGIQSIYEELGISCASNFYYSTVTNMIKNNVIEIVINKKKRTHSKEFISVVKEIFSEKNRDIIFKIILNVYGNRKTSPKEFNTLWLTYMLEKNGNLNNARWYGYSEMEKATFKRWLNYKNIEDFFEKYAVYPERKDYWHRWTSLIKDSAIRLEFKTALIMQFENHLIIEFGEVGAVRIYENKELTIREINSLFNNYPKTRAIKKIDFNYKEVSNTRWKHQGSWQWRFNSNMNKLGYRI